MIATASALPGLSLPARIQKASLDAQALVLEVFVGTRRFVVLRPGAIDVVDDRPVGAPDRTPPALQGLLRKEATPALITAALTAQSGDGVVQLVLSRLDGKVRRLVVERQASDPRVLLLAATDDGPRVLAVLLGAPRAKDGRDLRRGQLYVEPTASGPLVTTEAPASRAARDPLATLRAQLRAEHKRQQRLVDALERDLARHGDPARHERDGELLKTVLGRVTRGMRSVDVTDFDGAPRVVVLDDKRDAAANLSALFSRAKRARTAIARTQPRLEEARAALARLDAARAQIRDAPSAEDIAAAEQALGAQRESASPRRRVAREAGPRKAWRSFKVSRDVVVRVGRGAKDNDALVRDARGHDLWLHARDRVGAHVIVPSRGEDVLEDVLFDAATLAAHFSAARGEKHVEVQTARVKHLRKPGPGAPAGFFHVTEERVIGVRVDEERVARLLAAEMAS